MGFMGMADGRGIKVTVNCRSSAEFMRKGEKKQKKQCKYARRVEFLFQVLLCSKNNDYPLVIVGFFGVFWGFWGVFCRNTKKKAS